MAKPAADDDRFRYERKFLISAVPRAEVEQALRLHPASFRELYPQRFVNNCYFDSPGLRSFVEAVEGNRLRTKVRVRWYGELFGAIAEPVLEIKRKRGLLGSKDQFRLPPLALDRTSVLGPLREWVGDAEVTDGTVERFGLLRPTLINRYSRRYLISADRRFRITIDADLAYHRVTPPRLSLPKPARDAITAIIEIKYGGDADDGVSFITNHFPFRLTKSSKYVMGLSLLGCR